MDKHIDLVEAYEQLPPTTFAVWIRLHKATDNQLSAGRGKIAKMLGYSEGRSNQILRELKHRGYVAIIPDPKTPWNPSRIELLVRCKISGTNRFTKLNHHMAEIGSRSDGVFVQQNVLDKMYCEMAGNSPTVQVLPAVGIVQEDDFDGCGSKNDFRTKKTLVDDFGPMKGETVEKMGSKKLNKVFDGKDQPGKNSEGSEPIKVGPGTNYTKKHKFLVWNGNIVSGSETIHGTKSIACIENKRSIDLTKYSKNTRRAKRVLQKSLEPQDPRLHQPIDFDELEEGLDPVDLNGKPQVTFSPTPRQREHWLKLLGDPRKLTNKLKARRERVLEKLVSSFSRIYIRYRRTYELSQGVNRPTYVMIPSERKQLPKVVHNLLAKGVTPREALEYWHENIGNFANAQLIVPPISILVSPANIDCVAIAKLKEKHGRDTRRPRSKAVTGDVSLLDKRLRRAMMAAGFEMTEISDDYLTYVQACVVDYLNGYLEKGDLPEGMVEHVVWAAENFYKGLDLDRYI